MSPEEIVRAWKDEDFRESLSFEQKAALPEHPAGPLLSRLWELPEDEEARSLALWCPMAETFPAEPPAGDAPEGTR